MIVLLQIADVPVPLLGPIVALGGLTSSFISPSLRCVELSPAWTAVLTASVSLCATTPIAVALFAPDGFLQLSFGTLDLAGALPALQTAAVASFVGLAVFRRGRQHRGAQARERPRSWRTLASVVLIGWALWIAWLVGMELAIDEVTPRILFGGIVAPLLSVGAWLLVQRLCHDQTTREGAVAGLVTGLAAITAACGYVDAVGAAVIGIVSGSLASLVAHSLLHRAASIAWLFPVALSIGSGTGVVALGIFSARVGLAYTGQPELLFNQVASLAVVAGYAAAVSTALWILWRWLSLRRVAAT